jgi:hypothetical protein
MKLFKVDNGARRERAGKSNQVIGEKGAFYWTPHKI